MSDDVYKAVFECPGLKERVVWYVSSRSEAQKHMNTHIKTEGGGKVQKKYQENAYTVTMTKMFTDSHEVYYSTVNSWSGT